MKSINSLDNNFIEYIGVENSFIQVFDLYTEKFMQNILLVDNNHNPIKEITKVYVESLVIDYSLVPGFNSVSVDGSKITNNICVALGTIKLSVEYISGDSCEELCMITGFQYFSSFIMLPEDYIEGSNININCYVDYANVNKISSTQLFYYIHCILSFSIY